VNRSRCRRLAAYSCRLILLGATGLCLFGAPSFAQAPAVAPQLSDDESAVYTVLFQDLYEASKNRPIILIETTSIGVPPGLLTKVSVQGEQTTRFLARLSPETRQDYSDRNKEHARLPSPCHLAPDCVVFDVADIAPLVKNDRAWRGFMKKHPNAPGVVVVSRIGFNRDRTEAIVYVGRACGSICGEGEYVRLVKLKNSWAVDDHTVVWLSQK
jgi:hypothetical protein